MPALLKSKSTRLKASTVDRNNSSTAAGVEMSRESASDGFFSFAETSCNGSRRRPQITVFHPLLSSPCAAAAPTPVPPPVMIATRFSFGTFNLSSPYLFLETRPLVSQAYGPVKQKFLVCIGGEVAQSLELNDLASLHIFERTFKFATLQHLS